MYLDALTIHQFYQTVTGGLAKRVIFENIDTIWHNIQKEPICGLGFTNPYLDIFNQRGHPTLAIHSVYSGICTETYHSKNQTLADEIKLPLRDNSQKHILCCHLFEHSFYPHRFLEEMNRILRADGDILFVIPNRRGLWARFDHTPFGHGKPYGKDFFIKMLEEYNLFHVAYAPALFFPPKENPPVRLYVNMAEYIGSHSFLKRYAGVHIMRFVKQSYIPPQKIISPLRLKKTPSLTPKTV